MEDRQVELNIRIRREENSTGDNKSGWANSTLAEDKDSGINTDRGEVETLNMSRTYHSEAVLEALHGHTRHTSLSGGGEYKGLRTY